MSTELPIIEYDVATLQARTIARLENALGRTLAPGDPLRVIALAFVYEQSLVAASANYAANMSFLDVAVGDYLEALGALFGVVRRPAEPARTTLRFTIGSARDQVTLVPQGTRAGVSGSNLYFATEQAAEIPAGETTVDVIAAAGETGPGGNGYLAGEINTLIDTPPFVISVVNQTPSADGSLGEDDASMRERIREAPTRYSVAGPEDAYITLTKDSRADIESVAVESPAPREINVYFALTGGVIPAPETIIEVAAYLNDTYRRPMSDLVHVLAPDTVEYTVDLTYTIRQANAARAAEIQTAVQAAVSGWAAWQRAQLGRDINPSELTRRVLDAGAWSVEITAPTAQVLTAGELAIPDGDPLDGLSYGGLIDG